MLVLDDWEAGLVAVSSKMSTCKFWMLSNGYRT